MCSKSIEIETGLSGCLFAFLIYVVWFEMMLYLYITYAMSRNVNFLREQRLNFVSTAYSGPMEPISIDIQIEVGGRFQSL